MRSLLLLMALLILPLAVMPQSKEWQEFTPEGGNFKVMVPARPVELPPLLHPVTKIPNPTFLVKRNDERFRVSYYCFPQASTDPAVIQTRFQAARNRTLVALTDESQELTVKNEEYVNQKGISALEIKMDSKASAHTARIFVSERCVYLLVVTAKRMESISEGGKNFLDSFELLR